MIIIRQCLFSNKSTYMIEEIADRLENKGIQDFEVVDKIPKDVISLLFLPSGEINIYIPREFEYSQYEIDDIIRSISPSFRTRTVLDRDIYVMKLTTGRLNTQQCSKIVEKIIDLDGFCSLVIKD